MDLHIADVNNFNLCLSLFVTVLIHVWISISLKYYVIKFLLLNIQVDLGTSEIMWNAPHFCLFNFFLYFLYIHTYISPYLSLIYILIML